MVNGVSNTYNPALYSTVRTATQAAGRYSNDVENMVKYLNGQPLNNQDDMPISDVVKGNIPFVALFGGISGLAKMKKHGFNLKNTVAAVNAASPIKSRNQIMEAATSGVADKFKDVFKKSVVVDETSRGLWNYGKLLDKIPGYSKLRHSGFGQMMGKTGAGSWAVFGGLIEMFTQVVPAFQQGGASAGLKQVGKSAVKVAADTAGFVAGDVVCRGIGAAIGTAICPGVGTAIGSFIGGFMGGIVGSAIAGKAAKAVIGPSEVEKIQQEQVSQVAQQIQADPNTKLQIAQQTLEQANSVLAQDPENADALLAQASAAKTIEELTQQQQTGGQVSDSPATTQPQMPNAPMPQIFAGIPTVPGFNGMGYDLNQYRQSMQNTAYVSAFGLNNSMNQFMPSTMNMNPFSAQTRIA